MKKQKFHLHRLRFTDKTSSAIPDDKGHYPKIWLNVKVNAEIPMSHRICR